LAVRGRDVRPEYARSSDFRFGNATLIPLSLARIFPVTLPLFLSTFISLLLFLPLLLLHRLSGDGKYEREGTRAGTHRYTGTSSVQTYTLKRKHAAPYAHHTLPIHSQTHAHIHTYNTHTRARENERNFVSNLPQATALLAHLGAPWSYRVGRKRKSKSIYVYVLRGYT